MKPTIHIALSAVKVEEAAQALDTLDEVLNDVMVAIEAAQALAKAGEINTLRRVLDRAWQKMAATDEINGFLLAEYLRSGVRYMAD